MSSGLIRENVTSRLVRGTGGGLRWEALPDWEAILFGPKGLRLDEWQANGQAVVVKQGVHRTVYRVELAEHSFYVKHYRRTRFWDAVADLVRSSPARREWQRASQIADRGVACVKPVAWAELVRQGPVRDSYHVTQAAESSLALDSYLFETLPQLPAHVQQVTRRKVVRALASFVATIHQAGIIHDDFHVGNVLVGIDESQPQRPMPGDPIRLLLVDVPGLRFRGPLDWSASRKSLVVLASAWWDRSTPSERLRFWRTYLLQRPDLELTDERSIIQELDSAGRRYSQRVARHRDKRCLRTNRSFRALRHRRGRAHVVADFMPEEIDRLLGDPDLVLWRNLDRPVKLSHSRLIVRTELLLANGPVEAAYKRYRPRNWWKAVLGKLRTNRAFRAWRCGHALLERRIDTARPLFVCDLSRQGARPESYLATEWIEDAENLHLYAWRLAEQDPADRLRRASRCAASLGWLVGRMHAWQISHGDLKASNLLIVERGEEIRSYLIDADDVHVSRRLSFARQAADLSRLATSMAAHAWVTRTLVCRFFRAYVGQLPSDSRAWKPLWQEAGRRANRRIGRKRRRKEEVL